MEEHEFGSSSDDKDEDLKVPALPRFSPLLFSDGENMDDSGDCDEVGRAFWILHKE